eukprot:80158_1
MSNIFLQDRLNLRDLASMKCGTNIDRKRLSYPSSKICQTEDATIDSFQSEDMIYHHVQVLFAIPISKYTKHTPLPKLSTDRPAILRGLLKSAEELLEYATCHNPTVTETKPKPKPKPNTHRKDKTNNKRKASSGKSVKSGSSKQTKPHKYSLSAPSSTKQLRRND